MSRTRQPVNSHTAETKGLRVLHVSMLGKPLAQSPGFRAQMESEVVAARSLDNATWESVLVLPAANEEDTSDYPGRTVKIPTKYPGKFGRRLFLWNFVRKNARAFDVVIVRHSVIDPFQAWALVRVPNLAIVHHTKSSEELREAGHPLLARIEAALLVWQRRVGRWPIGVTEELFWYARGERRRALKPQVLQRDRLGQGDHPSQPGGGREGRAPDLCRQQLPSLARARSLAGRCSPGRRRLRSVSHSARSGTSVMHSLNAWQKPSIPGLR